MEDTKELLVTLWPTIPHYGEFDRDERISAIRMNSAMISNPDLQGEIKRLLEQPPNRPVFFDVKGRQPRVTEVVRDDEEVVVRLNHPVSCRVPCDVVLKGGKDSGQLGALLEDNTVLKFSRRPRYTMAVGESLCIRDPLYVIHVDDDRGGLFTEAEREKIASVRAAGFNRYFLSYVEEASDVERFLELTGPDAEVWLKVESERGMQFVERDFAAVKARHPNVTLVAARGDLFVELERPHKIGDALRAIIRADPKACVASRLLLSVIDGPVPSCADLCELEWLWDLGYRRYMLCDEMCLNADMLRTCVNVFSAWFASK